MNAFLRFLVLLGFQSSLASVYCPEGCICFWYVDYSLKINCSGSQKMEISDLNTDDSQVKLLDLSHSDIKSFRQSKFLNAIEEVNLSNNRLTQVSFRNPMIHLKSIDLSYNSFTNLKKVDVGQLKSLRKLDLSFNTKLHEISGLKSDSLQDLNVSHCFISSVDEDFFDGLPNIRLIDISFNFLRSLKNIKSKSLQNIDASNSKIEILTHRDAMNLPELIALNTSFNPNLKIELSYEDSCWRVKNLDLSYSNLYSLKEMFPFCSLTVLNASFNQIEVIDVRTFYNNWELIFVNLSNNRLTEIHSHAFYTTDKLKVLDLSANQIQNVSFTFHLKQVQNLNLSRNRINSLIGLMLKRAAYLNLSQNQLTEVSTNFNEQVPDLKDIDLSMNKIKRIGRISSKSVMSIDLSFNLIETIDTNAFDDAFNIISINLAGNRLTMLDHRTFRGSNNLRHLNLKQNPWTCLCDKAAFKDLYEYLMQGGRPHANPRDLKCEKTNDSWTNTCSNKRRGAHEWEQTLYSLTVSLAISLIIVAVIYACKFFNIKNNNSASEEERDYDDTVQRLTNLPSNSSENLQGVHDLERLSNRNSTPPPNYEAALLLHELSEEEARTCRFIEGTATDGNDGQNRESEQNECLTTSQRIIQ